MSLYKKVDKTKTWLVFFFPEPYYQIVAELGFKVGSAGVVQWNLLVLLYVSPTSVKMNVAYIPSYNEGSQTSL